MTKFQTYIKRYASAINVFGIPGEAAHKFFVKAPGLKTETQHILITVIILKDIQGPQQNQMI
jgi:hypothetical protein